MGAIGRSLTPRQIPPPGCRAGGPAGPSGRSRAGPDRDGPCPDLTVVDSFTDRPFAGNPAAVAVVDAFPAEHRMQAVAREMNLSETAFLVARADGSYDLRWFTPDGRGRSVRPRHLGRGPRARGQRHVPHQERRCSRARRRATAGSRWTSPPTLRPSPAEPPAVASGSTGIRWCGARPGRSDLLVELADAAAVRYAASRSGGLAALGVRCVIVTAAGRPAGDRLRQPRLRPRRRDPRGPGHGLGALHAGAVLGRAARADELVGEQASARGGIVRMKVAGDRVILGGRAVTVSNVRMLV